MTKISQIYEQYKIPPNLRRHMYEVTAVCQYVIEHWTEDDLNEELVIRAALFHDMGNIIKFKRPFYGEMEEKADYWQEVQTEFIVKYGDQVHLATKKIIDELPVETQVIDILDEVKEAYDQKGTFKNCSLETRVVALGDTCVSPEGVVGYEERMKDLAERYEKSGQAWRAPFDENYQFIEQRTDVDLEELAEHDFSKKIEALQKFKLL